MGHLPTPQNVFLTLRIEGEPSPGPRLLCLPSPAQMWALPCPWASIFEQISLSGSLGGVLLGGEVGRKFQPHPPSRGPGPTSLEGLAPWSRAPFPRPSSQPELSALSGLQPLPQRAAPGPHFPEEEGDITQPEAELNPDGLFRANP